MKSLAVFALVAAMVLWSRPANATFYGPPVPDIKEGGFAVGAALSDISRDIRGSGGDVDSNDYSRETLFGDYGLSEKSWLRLELGTADFGRFRGTEIALGYRREIGEPSKFGENDLPLRKAVFASFRTAKLSAGDDAGDDAAVERARHRGAFHLRRIGSKRPTNGPRPFARRPLRGVWRLRPAPRTRRQKGCGGTQPMLSTFCREGAKLRKDTGRQALLASALIETSNLLPYCANGLFASRARSCLAIRNTRPVRVQHVPAFADMGSK